MESRKEAYKWFVQKGQQEEQEEDGQLGIYKSSSKNFSFGIRFAKHKAMGSEVPVTRFACNKLEKLAIR